MNLGSVGRLLGSSALGSALTQPAIRSTVICSTVIRSTVIRSTVLRSTVNCTLLVPSTRRGQKERRRQLEDITEWMDRATY